MKKDNHMSKIATYFEQRWELLEKWCYADETLGIHYGYYDKNIKGFKDAVLNMNELVGNLLELDENKSEQILDAGCGVGGTSIYLGKKYPNIQFTGITNSKKQVEIGRKFIREGDVNNCRIIYGDFLKTEFPNDYFNSVFAIESVGYSPDVKSFIIEMRRILKPGGKLIVLDGFRTEKKTNLFFENIYKIFLYARGYQKLDLPHIKNYISLLKKFGFNKIYHKDISKNVARSQIRGIILAIPFFISYLIKYILSFGQYDYKKNYFDFSMGAAVLTPIIALDSISRYYITTAKNGGK